jgi:hypothetical protein
MILLTGQKPQPFPEIRNLANSTVGEHRSCKAFIAEIHRRAGVPDVAAAIASGQELAPHPALFFQQGHGNAVLNAQTGGGKARGPAADDDEPGFISWLAPHCTLR